MKYLAAGSIAGVLLAWPAGAAASQGWQQWQTVTGVFDLAGPRSDGSLVVAGSGQLYVLTPDGALSPFAHGDDAGAEAYIASSPGVGCFNKDEIFALRLRAPVGVTRISADGSSISPFANVDVSSLNGIAFDTAGFFDHRLLVTGPVNGKTEVSAVDCRGTVQVLTRVAPVAEGGLAVAPVGFGGFAGDLLMPDELSGIIWAVAPDGSTMEVVDSGLPKGPDTGVESLAFVPAGFTVGGYLYYSDRLTPGNPHPGTDHVLRLSSVDLAAAGVQDGDLLAATEGGASMIDVRCDSACHVVVVVPLPTSAHGEGHLAFTLTPRPPSPVATAVQAAYAPPPSGPPLGAVIAVLAVPLGAIAVFLYLVRRRR